MGSGEAGWSGLGGGESVTRLAFPPSTVCLSHAALSTGYNLSVCQCIRTQRGLSEPELITPPSGSAAILQSSSGIDTQLSSEVRSPSHECSACCITAAISDMIQRLDCRDRLWCRHAIYAVPVRTPKHMNTSTEVMTLACGKCWSIC